MSRRTDFKGSGERPQPRRLASAVSLSALLVFGQTAPLLGNPTGGAVVAGNATIGAAGPTLSINQSTQNAIINWQQFSIANGETTKFLVPNGGATLNRVTGGNPSAIYGNLQSNGTLYLVNPSGLVVGPGGRIDTAGFLASTLDVSNEQFLAGGELEFVGSSDASVRNDGTIDASTGNVYLIASQVTNTGTLSAPRGMVGLAAGTDVLFQQAGSDHLFVQATPTSAKRAIGVTNAGTVRAAAAELKAAGGNAYALAINNTGGIAATGYRKFNGQVYLTSDGGSISNSGRITARQANGNGGKIAIDGTALSSTTSGTVTDSGTLDASATVAGGQGGAVSLKNLTGSTDFTGTILAKGGQVGMGGNAEVSGAKLSFTGSADLTAPGGTTGNLLIDPTALDVITGGTGTVVSGQNDSTSTAIDPATVETALGTANLTLNADTVVTISDAITWTSANTLTLSTNAASSTIAINAPISGVNGGLTLNAGASGMIGTGAAGSVSVAGFILQNGTWSQVTAVLPSFTASSNFQLQNSSTFLRATGGTGSSSNPYQVADVYGLQGIGSPSNTQLGLSFELAGNIDATGTASWNNGAGFVPIGSDPASGTGPAFTGTFNGQGQAIGGLSINSPSVNYAGLFGEIGSGSTVQNVSMTNVQAGGNNDVGGLAGVNDGAISDSSSRGAVSGAQEVGGLVGQNNGIISNGSSAGTVSGSSSDVGGLAGNNTSSISDSSSTAAVSGNTYVSGLVGDNSGMLSASFSTGTVSGNQEVGGLVGANTGTIGSDYSTGAVTGLSGSQEVGGLAGSNDGTIGASYATGSVSGTYEVGGLVGDNGSSGMIGRDYSSGGVSGTTFVGGLVGYNLGSIDNAFSESAVTTASGGGDEGGLAGFNGGTIGTTYSTGLIMSAGGNTEIGGLVGYNQSTISNSFWDTASTGIALGVGSDPTHTTPGVTGGTTAQLESQSFILTTYMTTPWDFTNVWTTLGDTDTPQLIGLPNTPLPSGLAMLSGTAFTDSGVTAASSGLNINLIFDGSVLGATTTNGSGAFTFTITARDLTGGILLTDPTDNGTIYYQATTPASAITGVDIWGGTLRVDANAASNTALGIAAGSLGGNGINYAVSGSTLSTTSGVNINIVSAYTLDGNITASGSFTTGITSALTGSQNVTLTAGSMNLAGSVNTTGTVSVNATGAILDSASFAVGGFVLQNGTWTEVVGQNGLTTLPAFTDSGDFELQGTGSTFERFAGGNGVANAYQITDVYGFQGLASPSGNLLSANAELNNNIDATGTVNWNGGAGFVPIGMNNSPSTGTFDGQGNTINGLDVNLPGTSLVGVFGVATGTLENVNLTGLQVSGYDYVGGLVGVMGDLGVGAQGPGSVINCSSSGTVIGGSYYVGGLIGVDHGVSVTSSFTAGSVSGQGFVGGLDGTTSSTMNDVYSTASVSASGSGPVGGLLGENYYTGVLHNAYSTGTVSGPYELGGLVGRNNGTINNSFWDTDTAGSGVVSGVGSDTVPNTTPGVTASTTAQLESQTYILANSPTVPTWDFTSTWTTVNGTNTPQLIGLPETTPPNGVGTLDSLSGTAFTDNGVTLSPDVLIDLIFDSSPLSSTTTNGSGGFTFTINSNELTGGILLTDATDQGNTYYQANSPAGSITGVDLWGNTLRVLANAASNTALGTVAGSLNASGINYSVLNQALATNAGINLSILSRYTLDGNITSAGALNTAASSALTGSTAVTLAANSMNLGGSLTDSGVVTLDSIGAILADADVSLGGFILENGTWTQLIGQNGLAALPAFTDSGDFQLQGTGSSFERFAGGDGSSAAPYQVTDVYGLQGLASPSDTLLNADAELDNNIDATSSANWNAGAGFVPIGSTAAYYTGTFNGQGHTISGLHINRPGTSNVGLFGVASTVLENVALTGVQVMANSDVGGLVGSLGNPASGTPSTGVVSHASSSGTVIGQSNYVGGLLGLAHGTSISESFSAGAVSGNGFIGGLVGSSLSAISNAYSTASVSGSGPVGGLVGENYYGGTVSNTYSAGLVNGSSETGGLVGRNLNTVDNSFWDTTTSGITSPTGGVGSGTNAGVTAATSTQLQSQSFILANAPTIPTWDFSNVWSTLGGTSAPQLSAGGTSTQPVPPPVPPPSTGSGSNIVPPAIVTLNNQIDPQQPRSLGNTPASTDNSSPPPIRFADNGTTSQTGEPTEGQLANSSSIADQIGADDVVQLNNGNLDNSTNPAAASALDQALGPAVRAILADALKAAGDTVADFGDNTSSPDITKGETVLEGGDVVEMDKINVKSIPLSQAPKALQDALGNDIRDGLQPGAGTGH